MPIVTVTLPSDQTTADVADYNDPITQILSVLNGQLDDANITSLNGAKIIANTLPLSALSATAKNGWIPLSQTPNTMTYNGQNNYDIVYNGVDLTPTISPGMKHLSQRSVTAPTQCTVLNGTNHFWSKASPAAMTFTNNFVVDVAFKSINTAAFYNMSSNKSTAIFLGSNFILNNHKRNQVVGSFTASFPGVTINYYNDGAFPFDKLPFADNFDRWWTGGFGFYFHNRQSYNNAEFTFDQFTGYSPLLYELSNLIGINLPDYNMDSLSVAQRKKTLSPAFNKQGFIFSLLKIFDGVVPIICQPPGESSG